MIPRLAVLVRTVRCRFVRTDRQTDTRQQHYRAKNHR